MNAAIDLRNRPKSITIDRPASRLNIVWFDGHASAFELRWLRANCPCATCREERRQATMERDVLMLSSGPLPSTEIVNAELVGNYAVRLDWGDGHATGIYAFSILRSACPCSECHPDGVPSLLPE